MILNRKGITWNHYILLARIDYCVNLMESQGIMLMNQDREKLFSLWDKIKWLKHITLFDTDRAGKNDVFDLIIWFTKN